MVVCVAVFIERKKTKGLSVVENKLKIIILLLLCHSLFISLITRLIHLQSNNGQQWGAALRDDAKNGCVAEIILLLLCHSLFISLITRLIHLQSNNGQQWGAALRDDAKNGCVAD